MKKFAKNMKRAFTITELVIVIAVIAILAAVLIPTFSSVINSAKESAAMQECHNALTNISARVEKEGQSTVGMALKNGDYLYINLNGSLNLLENYEDNAHFTHSSGAVEAKNTEWATSTQHDINGKKLTLASYVTGFVDNSYSSEIIPDTSKEYGMTVTITNAESNGGGKSSLDITLSANEDLYLYLYTDNGTTYLGYFTLEMNMDTAENTENNGTVVYSSRYGYVAIAEGASIAFGSAKPE